VPRRRFFNLDGKARERLLRVAAKHFARRGFERASLNEILGEVGISKGAYYYYFEDKEDLFATVLELTLEELMRQQPAWPDFDALTKETFWPTVSRLVDAWVSRISLSSDLFQAALMLTEAQRRSPRFAPLLAKSRETYRTLIEPGQRLGCIRTDLPVGALIRLLEANDAVLDAIFTTDAAKVTRERLARHAQLVFDTFHRLLIAEPGFAPASKPKPRRARLG
jgi:AcrR family transcriptional regulator